MNLKLFFQLSCFEHGYISHITALTVMQLKLQKYVKNILMEGSMSQIFSLGLSFYFMSKKRVNFCYVFRLNFLDFIK